MNHNIVPAESCTRELKVANSRFIADISPAATISDARDFIAMIKQRYPDASHHVPAFLVGTGSSVTAHCSDDGEPSGTAGRPILTVLEGSGLGDAVLVVTRYFGGTKLGTGGLVKAYTASAQTVIEAVPRAQKIPVHACRLVCDYAAYESLARLIKRHSGQITNQDFHSEVEIEFIIPPPEFTNLEGKIQNITNGKVLPIITGRNLTAIQQIPSQGT